MVILRSITLLATLAAAVTAQPTTPQTNQKRQDAANGTGNVLFRSDLKFGEGQSPQFKNRFLSVIANNASASGFDIDWINQKEAIVLDEAAKGQIESKGIPLYAANSTLYMNVGYARDPTSNQPVTLGTTQASKGFLYTQGGELKLGSTNPQWDTWLICDGALETPGFEHPVLRWAAVVRGLVTFTDNCSAVRLFVVDPKDPYKNMGSSC